MICYAEHDADEGSHRIRLNQHSWSTTHTSTAAIPVTVPGPVLFVSIVTLSQPVRRHIIALRRQLYRNTYWPSAKRLLQST